jgi:hypothetical protein
LKWPRYYSIHDNIKAMLSWAPQSQKCDTASLLLLRNSKKPIKGAGLGLRFRIEFSFVSWGSQDREDWLEPGSKPHKIPLDMGLDILQILLTSSLLASPWAQVTCRKSCATCNYLIEAVTKLLCILKVQDIKFLLFWWAQAVIRVLSTWHTTAPPIDSRSKILSKLLTFWKRGPPQSGSLRFWPTSSS